MEKNAPMMMTHQGRSTGQTKLSRIPVTTALRSPTMQDFFMSLRYAHSKNTQDTTETAVSSSAFQPKQYTLHARAGSSAMITSSMMLRVSSLERMWGEEDAISFRFL